MRVVNLSCNECGAPLVVPKRTNYLTCQFCGTQLHVVHEGGAAYTEVRELAQRTDRLEEDVAALKVNEELERLDDDWRRQMAEYGVKGKADEARIPSKHGVLIGSGAVASFGVIWTIVAIGMASGASSTFGNDVWFTWLFPLFGVVFVLAAVGSGFAGMKKLEEYEDRRRSYERERHEIVEAIRRRDD